MSRQPPRTDHTQPDTPHQKGVARALPDYRLPVTDYRSPPITFHQSPFTFHFSASPLTPPMRPITNSISSKKDLVKQALRVAILSGELAPGTRLIIDDLANQ